MLSNPASIKQYLVLGLARKKKCTYPVFVAKSCRNRYDKDAVSLNYRGEELALLCRGKIQEMALDYLSCGDGGYAIISSIDDSEKIVKVHLGFYKGCDFPKDDE